MLYFEICISGETLGELTTVLMRSKFDKYATTDIQQAFIVGFEARTRKFAVSRIVTDCPDPGDNKFLALAETAEAELILSGDPHLLDLHPWRDIPILPPAAFLVGIR